MPPIDGMGADAQYSRSGGEDGPYVHASPLHWPPQGSVPIERTARSAGVAGGGTVTVLTIDVPIRMLLRIVEIGFGSADPTGLVHATWTLKRGLDPFQGYGSLPCAIGSLAKPARVAIFQEGEARLTFSVTNGFPKTAFRYICRVRGWMWTKEA